MSNKTGATCLLYFAAGVAVRYIAKPGFPGVLTTPCDSLHRALGAVFLVAVLTSALSFVILRGRPLPQRSAVTFAGLVFLFIIAAIYFSDTNTSSYGFLAKDCKCYFWDHF